MAILHANGLVTFSSVGYWFDGDDISLKPGDQLLILPAVDSKILQAVKDITQIIFQLAVAANVVID